LVALAIIWLFFSLSSPYFLTVTNIYNILLQASTLTIVAVGLTIVLITAEIDLSIGSVEALTGSVAAVVIINEGVPVVPGVILALGCAVLVGLINGLVTTKLGVVSFITTLAMLGIVQGIAFLLTNGQAVAGFPDLYHEIGRAKVLNGFPVPAFIALGVVVGCWLLLTKTRLGLHFYAVGANQESAALSGLRPKRVKMIAMVLGSFLAGVGGLILSSRLDAGNGLFGESDLLNAVAAVVIGGASLFGGVGTVVGTAIGVLIIASIGNGMVLLNVAGFWQQIVVGGFIIAAVVNDQATQKGAASARHGRLQKLLGGRSAKEGHAHE
jgi:ribose/xylose/arabinose/galactoside ABC-type transport system permease subunit